MDGIKTGLARSSKLPGSVISMAVDTWGVDFALVDGKGHLLGLPYHYRDPRTEGILNRVFTKVSSHEIFRRTGNQLMPINTLFQLYWMIEQKDPRLDCAANLLMMPDLFNRWLSGEAVTEYTIASTTQMTRISTGEWDTELLHKLEIPTQLLPKIVAPGTSLGRLHLSVSGETGLEESVKVIAVASHDTASAVAAVPYLDDRSLYISSGTWNLVGVELDGALVDDRVEVANFTNEGGVERKTRFLKNTTGFWLVQESARCWDLPAGAEAWRELMDEAERAPALQSVIDPDDPVFLSPHNMVEAIREYCRRTDQKVPHERGEVIRCCLESMALKTRFLVEEIEKLTGRRHSTIRIVGGGSLNSLFCSLLADSCRRLVVAGPAEATTLGNILVQAIATGEIGSIAEGRRVIADSVALSYFEPSPRSEQWEEALLRLRGLMERRKNVEWDRKNKGREDL